MNQQRQAISARVIAQALFFVIVIPLLPLLVSRQWDWWEAWVYAFIYIFGFAASRALAARRHPDLLAERARLMQHEDIEPWDRWLAPLVGLGGGLIPLVAGLDALFGWPPDFGLPWELVALAFILAGMMLGSYALIANRYFSGVVRIQTDRDHRVVSGGPYRWVRHPGYAAALMTYLATPIFLDAASAYIPALFLTVALVIRTRLEDRTLQAGLPGYREYAQRVRYRLLPGVW
jgi:protein-S-isoprenylcysteine O-methyltransferase Ste14